MTVIILWLTYYIMTVVLYNDCLVIIMIIIIIWSPLCKAGGEWEHSISPKTATPRDQPMEGRKR